MSYLIRDELGLQVPRDACGDHRQVAELTGFYSVEYIRARRWRCGDREAGGWEEVLARISDEELDRIEREGSSGLSSSEILDVFASHEIKFSEATLRKWVQLGLLPRSVRVGRKGKHQGSQGMYPAPVVRQIQRIKGMMAQDYTIEEIQREFLFVRGDIEELERTLGKVFEALRGAAKSRQSELSARAVANELTSARALAHDLIAKLESIEQRLMAAAAGGAGRQAVG